jgi:hypothetical protein
MKTMIDFTSDRNCIIAIFMYVLFQRRSLSGAQHAISLVARVHKNLVVNIPRTPLVASQID